MSKTKKTPVSATPNIPKEFGKLVKEIETALKSIPPNVPALQEAWSLQSKSASWASV